MLQHLITFVHGLLCFAIVALVLLQRGKGADAGAGFGAGASGTVFGARGSATFFSKLTAVLATLFFATSMTLAYLSSSADDSLQRKSKLALEKKAPAAAPDFRATSPASSP